MNLDKAIKELKDENEQCYERCEGCCSEVINNVCTCRDATIISELEQYRAIGTAGERQGARKPVLYQDTNRADCPVCGNTVRGIDKPFGDWCSRCGQKLDWRILSGNG